MDFFDYVLLVMVDYPMPFLPDLTALSPHNSPDPYKPDFQNIQKKNSQKISCN